MKVPYLDLEAHHRPIREELLSAISAVVDSSAFAGGPFVEAFECDFARYCGVRHAVGVGNGTDALYFALVAMGVGSGDEVISPPNTFIAIAEAVERCGGRLVFVDVDERTCTMDPNQLDAAITRRTKAIVPVHLFGQVAEVDAIWAVARRRGVQVLEDASQAHGARYRGKRAGQFGTAAAFSFYPGKNLGALGEAGAVVTDDDALAEKIRILRDHGQYPKYNHTMVGWNARMDGIQAAALSVKLRHLNVANGRRRGVARQYQERLSGRPDLKLPYESPLCEPVYHIYAVRVPASARDDILAALTQRDVGCSVHYPVSLHLQPAYSHLHYGPGDFPVAERCAASLISLPMYPELKSEQIDYVCDTLIDALENHETTRDKLIDVGRDLAPRSSRL